MKGLLGSAVVALIFAWAALPAAASAADSQHPQSVYVNGKSYHWPVHPTVVILIDGNDPEYIKAGIRQGVLPNFKHLSEAGFATVALSAMPSFTNPNNISVITGQPPAVHGITGNYFLDPESGQAVMMNQPQFVRAESILAAFSRQGAKVVALTAKNKLAKMLASGINLENGISFSSEKADTCTKKDNGTENCLAWMGRSSPPDIYSPDLSLAMLEAGLRIYGKEKPDLMYLSTSDYMQHTYAPGSQEANDFYAGMDRVIGRLVSLGATVAVTADHGMNDKSGPDGKPNVIFLQDVLDRAFGAGKTRVILPITDPYVKHHGALGSYATVFIRDSGLKPTDVMAVIAREQGVDMVMERYAAARNFELPPDRIGDLIVSADRHTVIGGRQSEHDLTKLAGNRLRSHGGLSDRNTYLMFSRPLNDAYAAIAASRRLRNYDAFDFALNGLK
ncbi:MAG: phosphonoacetate hydrolase [Betaproteobacteria bacterium]|nr:phosphonoacetate hydrolase [Betaproteobacteria bacterium]